MDAAPGTDAFEAHRRLLFTVAYEMLASAADAEDVVQETWLQWASGDRRDVRDARAFLIRIVTRQAINRLRAVSRRREQYVGEWLPEPLLTTPDVADDVELAESTSIAMLTVLDTLNPTERAVFVLREVFAVPYEDLAESLDKSPAAVRQIAHRARKHVEARRPRIPATPAQHHRVVERLLAAMRVGDVDRLISLLAPDVVAVGDGGGLAPSYRRPLEGAARVAHALAMARRIAGSSLRVVWVNGAPAIRVDIGSEPVSVMSLEVDDGRISRVYGIANPEKLTRLDRVTRLER